MKIKALQLTERAWDIHKAELHQLLSVMTNLFEVFGGYEPFDDGSEWTVEKAEARLLQPGVLTPVARAVLRAWQCVLRSLRGAASQREQVLTLLLELKEMQRKVGAATKEYQKVRSQEVTVEASLDEQIGWDSLHGRERERLVENRFRAWRQATKAAYLATVDLCITLHEERPLSLDAGMYSGNGSGCLGEFGMRLVAQGVHPNHAALIRNDVRISDPSLSSKTQKKELQNKGRALRKDAVHAAKRLKTLLS